MTNDLLKLNDDKTDIIINTTSEITRRQENIVTNIGDSPIHNWRLKGGNDHPKSSCI